MSNEFAFTDTSEKLSTTLEKLIGKLQGQTITLRELMEAIGEQGLLLICAIASLPFLIPVSIPGVSTVFGAAIILVSLAITLNRLPWLPAGFSTGRWKRQSWYRHCRKASPSSPGSIASSARAFRR